MKRIAAWRPLLPGESITSWVTRLARANAIGLHELGTRALGETVHSAMSADLDMLASPRLLRGLAEIGGVPGVDLSLQSLCAHGHLFSSTARTSTSVRWVLDRRKSASQRVEGFWTQCCPRCLASDADPFYRYTWRLAFVTECPEHAVELIDRCWNCASVLDFAISERRLSRPDRWHPLSRCCNCGENLGAYADSMRQSRSSTIAGQERFLRGLATGWAELNAGTYVWSGLFLDGCYRLARQLRGSEAGFRLGDLIAGDVAYHRVSASKQPFEALTVEYRRGILDQLYSLLEDWPARFIDLAKRARFTLSEVRGQTGHNPYWLDGPARWALNRRWYAPCEAEVDAGIQILERRGLRLKKMAAVAWTGKATPEQRLGRTNTWPFDSEQPHLIDNCPTASQLLIQGQVRRLVRTLFRYCIQQGGGRRRGGARQIGFDFTATLP